MCALPAPRPWSTLNAANVSQQDWDGAWPQLEAGLAGGWNRIKADRSGDIYTGTLRLAGQDVQVFAKRPRRTRTVQWLVDLFRPARARRAWKKTWMLFSRGLPTEIPLLVLERRRGPAVTDNLVVFEAVPGSTLFHVDLDGLDEAVRRDLLGGVGEVIRAIERSGFTHIDAKTTNWIAFPDAGGLRPVMLDCDGVRLYPWPGAGLRRFLRALVRHPHFRPGDIHAVCDGYAPEGWSRRVRRISRQHETPSPRPPAVAAAQPARHAS